MRNEGPPARRARPDERQRRCNDKRNGRRHRRATPRRSNVAPREHAPPRGSNEGRAAPSGRAAPPPLETEAGAPVDMTAILALSRRPLHRCSRSHDDAVGPRAASQFAIEERRRAEARARAARRGTGDGGGVDVEGGRGRGRKRVGFEHRTASHRRQSNNKIDQGVQVPRVVASSTRDARFAGLIPSCRGSTRAHGRTRCGGGESRPRDWGRHQCPLRQSRWRRHSSPSLAGLASAFSGAGVSSAW